MTKILVPVDGSDTSTRAVEHVIRMVQRYKEAAEIHLLSVHQPVPYARVESVVGHDTLSRYYHEEGTEALKTARGRLDAAGIPYHYHIGVGDPAETIARYAQDKHCDHVVMGTRGMGSVSNLLLGSVATKVIHLCTVPVTLVR